jgi:subtilisin-like proprotein convertase family protein
MRISKLLSASALLAVSLDAQVYTFDYSSSPVAIPDGNGIPTQIPVTISSAGTSISSIKVTLNITGDFNGDLYFDLRHGAGTSVLLNRTGVTSGNPFGYDDHGFNITLSDGAANDVHNYQLFSPSFNSNGQLTGEWQPDGRAGDPATASRTASLSTFQGVDPNGQWTLFVADLQNAGTSQLQSWGMELTVVPEPQSIAFVAGLTLLGFGLWRRVKSSGVGTPALSTRAITVRQP